MQDVGGNAGVKAAHREAARRRLRADAADQRAGGTLFALYRGEHVQREADHIIALGFYAHDVLIVLRRRGEHIHIHRRRNHLAVLVVGMVAADFGSAGGRPDAGLSFAEQGVKLSNKLLNSMIHIRLLSGYAGINLN